MDAVDIISSLFFWSGLFGFLGYRRAMRRLTPSFDHAVATMRDGGVQGDALADGIQRVRNELKRGAIVFGMIWAARAAIAYCIVTAAIWALGGLA